jgi:hypothetical protein
VNELNKVEKALIARLRQLRAETKGRCRVQIDLLMIDDEWFIDVIRPGKLERLGVNDAPLDETLALMG